MKLTAPKIAILAFAACVALPLSARAEPANSAAAFAEKSCGLCHGQSAQGYAVAPQLAGQHPEYIEKQLMSLKGKARNNPYSARYMWHAAEKVSPQFVHELALYFSSLTPQSAANGDEALAAKGKAIFEAGVPADNIVACQFCHGPRAQGTGIYPRLAGQSYYYMKRRLQQWNEGYSQSSEHMPGIANTLSPEQTEAVASYLSFLK
jgi:cytochrome c553